jgi:hypothetical protein
MRENVTGKTGFLKGIAGYISYEPPLASNM